MVGASGAIAGVMGAYMVKFPRARIETIAIIVFFIYALRRAGVGDADLLVRDPGFQRRGQYRVHRR